MTQRGQAGPFQPNAAMRRYASACESEKLDGDEARCQAAGVKPALLARWRTDARFNAWLNADLDGRMRDSVWAVWVVVCREAREGNLQAAKIFLERFDGGSEKRDSAGPETFRELAEMAGTT